MAIASRAAECAQLLDKYASTLAGNELLMQDMENQIFRFNLWAANNFILAHSRASMDWRLRSAPLLQSTMAELLDDLKADLITQIALPQNGTVHPGMQGENPFHAVSETLDCLFRLSHAIRRSGILRRYVKVGSYVEYDENGVNLTDGFRSGAKMLIEFRMKESKATKSLRERIIDTVCLRQQYFSYQKAKKAKNLAIDQSHQYQSSQRSALRATVSVTSSLTSKASGNAAKLSHRMPRAGPSIMTATTCQPDRMQKAYSVKSAHEKTSHDVDCIDADIPPPPHVPDDLKESECPYCFLACPREELSGTRWKRHIIQDLMPYICVLEPCPSPDSLFESVKDWLSHMRNQHPASGWTCADSTHNTTIIFQSESGFVDHLHQYHEGQFDDDDINDIAAACYQQLPENIMIRECPFCPTAQYVEQEPGDMISHIACHLISFAQISLAGHADGGPSQSAWSGSKSDLSSQPASVGSLAERLRLEFTDSDDDVNPASVAGEEIPDADAELVHDLWQKVQKPEDPSPDSTLRHFVAQFERQEKKITKKDIAGSNDSIMWQSFKEGQAPAPEHDSAGALQAAAREDRQKVVEMPGEQAYSTLDAGHTDDVPPFLCQTVSEICNKFEDLEWMQRARVAEAMSSDDPAHPYALESDPKVQARSRYVNVQAWANCRVHLRVHEGECDYINASPIILKDSVTQGKRTYIATQGPKLGYISHFWQMVFHESKDVAVIVMLTQTSEAGREKSAQYFPLDLEQASMILPEEESDPLVADESSQEETLQTTGKVTLLESTFDTKSCSEIRKLELTIGSESKIVWHFLFLGWADYSKPEGSDREALLELIKHSASKSGGPDNPRIVHCSAGVGRTGTFIALDHLLHELESGQLLQVADPETDPVFETVNEMRKQRMMMVYNDMQMQFIYEVLREQTGIKLGKVLGQNNESPRSQMDEPRLDKGPKLRHQADYLPASKPELEAGSERSSTPTETPKSSDHE